MISTRETKKEMLEGIQNVVTAKKIANNTVKATLSSGEEIVILHKTIIVSKKDGRYTLNSEGWRTPTTKERINDNTPLGRTWKNYLSQKNGLWYIGENLFYDGIVIDENGEIVSKKILPEKVEKKNDKMKAKITKFCKLITKDNLPYPNNGDCWLCSFHDAEGKSWGDQRSNDNDHLIQHLKENYLHGSLLVNAMREAGYRDDQIGFHYHLKFDDTFRRATRKYLQKRLLTFNG